MSRNNDNGTGSVLDFLHHWENNKTGGIDLSRQTNTSFPQQSNFKERLEDDGATEFIIAENKQVFLGIIKLSLDLLNVSE